nr:hypothetical protein [Kitasatospora griseola]
MTVPFRSEPICCPLGNVHVADQTLIAVELRFTSVMLGPNLPPHWLAAV